MVPAVVGSEAALRRRHVGHPSGVSTVRPHFWDIWRGSPGATRAPAGGTLLARSALAENDRRASFRACVHREGCGTERCAGSSISREQNWPNFDNLLPQSCRFRAVRYTGGVDDAGAPGVGQGGNAVSETIRGRSVERGFDGKQIYVNEFGSHESARRRWSVTAFFSRVDRSAGSPCARIFASWACPSKADRSPRENVGPGLTAECPERSPMTRAG